MSHLHIHVYQSRTVFGDDNLNSMMLISVGLLFCLCLVTGQNKKYIIIKKDKTLSLYCHYQLYLIM